MTEGSIVLCWKGQIPKAIRPKKECIKSCETCFVYTLSLNKGPSPKWVCFPKSYSPLANWPWLRISPQSSLFVIYCLILTAWQWLMSFTCIPVQIEPSKSPLRKRLLAVLFWEMGHLSSPSRSRLGRLILIRSGPRQLCWMKHPHSIQTQVAVIVLEIFSIILKYENSFEMQYSMFNTWWCIMSYYYKLM